VRRPCLAAYVPPAALAGVLAVVTWKMAEKRECATLRRRSRGDAAVVLATFLLVVLRVGTLLFLHRMVPSVEVESASRWRMPKH
jgi:SulP family sulfate permease